MVKEKDIKRESVISFLKKIQNESKDYLVEYKYNIVFKEKEKEKHGG